MNENDTVGGVPLDQFRAKACTRGGNGTVRADWLRLAHAAGQCFDADGTYKKATERGVGGEGNGEKETSQYEDPGAHLKASLIDRVQFHVGQHGGTNGRAAAEASTSNATPRTSDGDMPMATIPQVAKQSIISFSDKETLFLDQLRAFLSTYKLTTIPRIAGGWVRDKLFGIASADVDVALDNCGGRPFCEAFIAFVKGNGHPVAGFGVIEANAEQSKHLETACVHMFGLDLDFVNLRTETYSDTSRIPQIETGTPLEDALRRDSTMNSLFYNVIDDCIEDYAGGLLDMDARVIRTPLDPLATFRDDPLRVLRSVRFASRYGFSYAPGLVESASSDEVRGMLANKVSRERIGKEMYGILKSKRPASGLRVLVDDMSLLDSIVQIEGLSFVPRISNVELGTLENLGDKGASLVVKPSSSLSKAVVLSLAQQLGEKQGWLKGQMQRRQFTPNEWQDAQVLLYCSAMFWSLRYTTCIFDTGKQDQGIKMAVHSSLRFSRAFEAELQHILGHADALRSFAAIASASSDGWHSMRRGDLGRFCGSIKSRKDLVCVVALAHALDTVLHHVSQSDVEGNDIATELNLPVHIVEEWLRTGREAFVAPTVCDEHECSDQMDDDVSGGSGASAASGASTLNAASVPPHQRADFILSFLEHVDNDAVMTNALTGSIDVPVNGKQVLDATGMGPHRSVGGILMDWAKEWVYEAKSSGERATLDAGQARTACLAYVAAKCEHASLRPKLDELAAVWDKKLEGASNKEARKLRQGRQRAHGALLTALTLSSAPWRRFADGNFSQ